MVFLHLQKPPRILCLKNKSRQRFCLPYESFLELDQELNNYIILKQWVSTDCTGIQSACFELLLLRRLHYIGRAFTLDDIEEAAAISREVNRVFLQSFLLYGSTVLYDKYVT